MTGSNGGTLPTCPNGHPAAFAGQRFCEVCRMPIGAPAVTAAPEPVAPPPVQPDFVPVAPPSAFVPPPAQPVAPLPVFVLPPVAPPPVAPPPYFVPPPVAPLSAAPVVAGPVARGRNRSTLPMVLGLAVCVALAAGAVFVVAHPFGGGGASPTAAAGTALASPSVTPTATGVALASPTATPAATPTPAPTPSAAKWVAAGSLHAARASTSLLALTDGRALVVGDDNICDPGPAWDSSMASEVWTANKWTATGSLNSARDDLTAQPLANGQALVVGGTNIDGISFSSPKIWDPKTGNWNTSGLMATARSFPASALLKDGRVIVIGGEYIKDPVDTTLGTAEIFNPTAGKWTKTGSLKAARSGAMAVTLADGRVLVAGGYTAKGAVADSEIWGPASGTWTAIGATPIWGGSVLVPLPDGGALLAGGQDAGFKAVATAYRLDPKTDKWVATGKMLTAAYDRIAAVLADGRVLVAGGLPDHLKPAIAAAELFDPATGTWAATVPLPSAREQSKAVALQDGSILVAGGDAGYFPPASTPWCPKAITATLRYIPAP